MLSHFWSLPVCCYSLTPSPGSLVLTHFIVNIIVFILIHSENIDQAAGVGQTLSGCESCPPEEKSIWDNISSSKVQTCSSLGLPPSTHGMKPGKHRHLPALWLILSILLPALPLWALCSLGHPPQLSPGVSCMSLSGAPSAVSPWTTWAAGAFSSCAWVRVQSPLLDLSLSFLLPQPLPLGEGSHRWSTNTQGS